MKLAKKRDAAVLSFEIFGASRMGRRVKVEHDVRIEVLKPAEVARLSEPLCPEPDVSSPVSSLMGRCPSTGVASIAVGRNGTQCGPCQIHILLPPLLKIRTIVERLRPLADVIAVRANKSGKLQISAATESAKMDVVWEGCANPKMGASDRVA